MKRTSVLQSEDNNTNKENETTLSEKTSKKQKRDITERIALVASKLKERVEEHDRSKTETQNKIEEVCNIIRGTVDEMEQSFINVLQQSYTEEDTRLQEAINKLRTLYENDEMSEEEIDKEVREAESVLCFVQKYELVNQCDNMKEWINKTLNTGFNLSVEQLLSDETFRERVPRITEVRETGPNEVEVGIKFLEEEEKEIMKKMRGWCSVKYVLEMWNGEEGEDYEVKTTQIIGPSHKAFVEWRFVGGSECKVRVQAFWWGPHGEERKSEWSEWTPFTIPKGHKNGNSLAAGLVWEKREAGETYTVTDKTANKVLYNGKKPYFMLKRTADQVSNQRYDVLIRGCKDGVGWEETRTIEWEEIEATEEILEYPERLFDNFSVFHADINVCRNSLLGIVLISICKSISKHVIYI